MRSPAHPARTERLRASRIHPARAYAGGSCFWRPYTLAILPPPITKFLRSCLSKRARSTVPGSSVLLDRLARRRVPASVYFCNFRYGYPVACVTTIVLALFFRSISAYRASTARPGHRMRPSSHAGDALPLYSDHCCIFFGSRTPTMNAMPFASSPPLRPRHAALATTALPALYSRRNILAVWAIIVPQGLRFKSSVQPARTATRRASRLPHARVNAGGCCLLEANLCCPTPRPPAPPPSHPSQRRIFVRARLRELEPDFVPVLPCRLDDVCELHRGADGLRVPLCRLVCPGCDRPRWFAVQAPPSSCNSTLFKPFPGKDLSGTLVGPASAPGAVYLTTTESDCLAACCAAQPRCTAYSFQFSAGLLSASGAAPCFLLANVSTVVPVNGFMSGALYSAYSS